MMETKWNPIKLIITMTLISLRVSAFPINVLLGPGSPEYMREYSTRMVQWYFDTFIPSQKEGHSSEAKLFRSCMTHINNWGISNGDRSLLRSFYFAHRIQGNSVNHQKFFCAFPDKSKEFDEDLQSYLKSNDLRFERVALKPWGIEFDLQEKSVELRWLLPNEETMKILSQLHGEKGSKLQWRIKNFIKENKQKGILYPFIYFESYNRHRLQNAGVMSFVNDPPEVFNHRYPFGLAAISWSQKFSINKSDETFLQLKSFSLFYLSNEGRRIALYHEQEFNQLTLFMKWHSENDFELFYP